MYICPVCGYEKLQYPIEENPICPSCYTEFGFDDAMRTFNQLREDWIKGGMKWQGINVEHKPPNWKPIRQLALAGKLGNREAELLRSMGLLNKLAETTIEDEVFNDTYQVEPNFEAYVRFNVRYIDVRFLEIGVAGA